MEGTACAAAGSDGEVLLALKDALFLVSARDRMLETGRVGGVTGDGDTDVLEVHDGNAFDDVVSAVALDGSADTVRIRSFGDDVDFAGEVVHLGLNIGETVDSRDDLSGVFTKTVQDDAEGLLANDVRLGSNADGAFRSCEGLMTCQEAEALGLFFEEHLAEVAVAETDFSVVGDGAGDAEGLKAFADGGSSVRSFSAALLDGDGGADGVSPCGVFEADRLDALDHVVDLEACVFGDLLCFFDVLDTILVQDSGDLIDSSLVVFK